ncbi:MAG: protein kinase, partial [Polyangiaceae bacterium]|nr:protein kinase [Polyangiaceae bacterium]
QPLSQGLEIARDIAQGLRAAHREGLIHGNLQADAIILSETKDAQIFGFHRLGSRHATQITDPVFAPIVSPEELRGEPYSARTDLFHWACLCYRLLSGIDAFGPAGETVDQERILQGVFDLKALGKEYSPALHQLIFRCLQPSVHDRVESMQQVVELLERELRAENSAASSSWRSRPKQWRQSLLFGGLTLIAGLVGGLWLSSSFDTQRPQSPAITGKNNSLFQLKVLATPWAYVELNGERIATTPLAQPLTLPQGRHRVVFRHPQATDQVREIQGEAGDFLLLDVRMPIQQSFELPALPGPQEDETP